MDINATISVTAVVVAGLTLIVSTIISTCSVVIARRSARAAEESARAASVSAEAALDGVEQSRRSATAAEATSTTALSALEVAIEQTRIAERAAHYSEKSASASERAALAAVRSTALSQEQNAIARAAHEMSEQPEFSVHKRNVDIDSGAATIEAFYERGPANIHMKTECRAEYVVMPDFEYINFRDAVQEFEGVAPGKHIEFRIGHALNRGLVSAVVDVVFRCTETDEDGGPVRVWPPVVRKIGWTDAEIVQIEERKRSV